MIQNGYTEPLVLVEQTEASRSKRSLVAAVALLVILVLGAVCAWRLGAMEPAFAGRVDVAALAQDPNAYDLSNADGAAHVIVAKNLAETAAKNVCFSVVFNFRGYDTMGESFILISALAGSLCILRSPKRKAKGKEETDHGGATDPDAR